MSEQNDEKQIPVRGYHKWQLCELYGIGEKAFNAWLEPFKEKIGEQRGKKYTPDQVKIIFECLGTP